MGNPRLAAKGFEEYAKRFPDQADAESVYFRAGEQWEKVSSSEAIKFYERYISRYGRKNPDNLISAKYRIAQVNRGQGRKSAYVRAMDQLVVEYDRLVDAGTNLRPGSRHMVAERAFELLQKDYEEYATGAMVGIEAKDQAMLLAKDKEWPAIEEKALALIKKYNDFEYGLGAFYLMASSQLFIAELGYSMECPRKYSEEECDIWYEINDEQNLPMYDEYQEKAIERLKALIGQAKKKGRHTKWVDMAYETLNRLDPFLYPAVKEEHRGDSAAQDYPTMRPMSIDLDEEKQ
jgi:hypothetical protein